jgi:hypothetical protein
LKNNPTRSDILGPLFVTVCVRACFGWNPIPVRDTGRSLVRLLQGKMLHILICLWAKKTPLGRGEMIVIITEHDRLLEQNYFFGSYQQNFIFVARLEFIGTNIYVLASRRRCKKGGSKQQGQSEGRSPEPGDGKPHKSLPSNGPPLAGTPHYTRPTAGDA